MNLAEFLKSTDPDTYVCIACADGGGWMVIGPPSRIDFENLNEDKRAEATSMLDNARAGLIREQKRKKFISEALTDYSGWTERQVLRYLFERECNRVKRDATPGRIAEYTRVNSMRTIELAITRYQKRIEELENTDLSSLEDREVVEVYDRMYIEDGTHPSLAVKVTGSYKGPYYFYEEQRKEKWRYLL